MADRREQLGFLGAFAASKLGRNDRLDRIDAAVKWYRFEKLLKRLLPEPEGAGRPPYDALAMFKALLLAQLYDLSDAGLEEALNDRVSFRRFLGLVLDMNAPDHTTLCRFRNRLIEAGLIEKLFAEFNKQLEQNGGGASGRRWPKQRSRRAVCEEARQARFDIRLQGPYRDGSGQRTHSRRVADAGKHQRDQRGR